MTATELLAELAKRGVRLWADGDRLRFTAPDHDAIEGPLRDAIRAQRAQLLELLSAVRPSIRPEAIAKAPPDTEVRCSPAQERFLFSAELEQSSTSYRLDAAFRIVGALDIRALGAAIRDIVRRHEVLRSRFQRSAEGYTIVPTDWEPALDVVDFPGSDRELLAAIAQDPGPEFDLVRGPHFATRLYRLAADRHVLVVAMHHIVSDGGSISVFVRELQMLYAWRAGLAAEPAAPALQFRDIAHAQRATTNDEEALAFWKRELETAPPVITLAADRPRQAVRRSVGGSIALDLDAALLERLHDVRRATRASEFQIIVAALWLMLRTYSGQSSIVIGSPWRNRERSECDDVIGPLLNLLPLHIRPSAGATMHDLIAEVTQRTLAAIAHGNVPFERIVSHVRPERSASYTPVFQVMCAIETSPEDAVNLAGLTIEPLELPNEAARYDLAVVLRSVRGSLRGVLKYDRALFDDETAMRMARHFRAALELVLELPPGTPIARAQLMSAGEKSQLLRDWNATDRAYPLHDTLVDLVGRSVATSPERIAVESQGRALTYRELDQWSDAVARRLSAAGVGLDDVVGITLPRSLELIVAILGVLKSGAAYVPIDVQHPPDRRAWMLENAKVAAVIGPTGISVPHVDVGDGADEGQPAYVPSRRPMPDSACYVIYTSGSTGLPKGVVIDHRAIANNLLWMNDEWPLTVDDAVLFKTSPGFDVSVKEMFWPLIAGCRLVVAPPEASADPERLCSIITSSRISVVHMVPTMLDFFLRHESSANLPQLRIVMCGGEALSPALRARFHAASSAVLLHMYGPTEAAIAVTGYAISTRHAEVERLPLGRPMPNCRLYVVDAAFEPVPIGVAGELCIGGIPLARGYLARADLTADKFVPDPFSGIPGARLYRTGDLARWRADGQVEYLGRIDRQVKLGGLRIEPGEIEAVIRAQQGVDDAHVVVLDTNGARGLVAYVASRSAISAETLQHGMRARLPAFMIPSRFFIMPAFPINVNGKLDVAALVVPDAQRPHVANPPQGELEEALARIWCEVLKLETVDRGDDFFDLGGHSLLILQVQARLRDELGFEVSVPDLFVHTTVEGLAAHLSRSRSGGRRWLKKIFGIGSGSAS